MNTRYDLHLSAFSISPETIKVIEELGFSRDEFANNTRCERTAYHGTYRGIVSLPSNKIWNTLKQLLSSDQSFVGNLEEEIYDSTQVFEFVSAQQDEIDYSARCSFEPIKCEQPAIGIYKSCDIHINFTINCTSLQSLAIIDRIGMASFDKLESDGAHRIYSATCVKTESGRRLFETLKEIILILPKAKVKMKFEHITRYLRIPSDAPALPLIQESDLVEWFNNAELQLDRRRVLNET